MEALSILKFWRSQTAVADVGSEAAVATATTTTDDDETTDDEDSFIDLVFEPSNKNYHFVESPKCAKTSNLPAVAGDGDKLSSSPVTTLLFPSVSKPKPFSLSLKKSSKDDDADRQSKRFVRDNSLRSKMISESFGTTAAAADQTTSVSRYFRLIKPLVSKKGRVAEILSPFASPVNASTRKLTQGGRVGSFKISINVGRSSWKGRSVFPAAASTAEVPRRRDDSLLEQQNDGIQGAILHCKRSYSSSSSSSSSTAEFSQLIRSASDPSQEKFIAQGRYSCEEPKRCSI